jgi:hypothetical protein
MARFVPFARTPNLGRKSSRPGVSVDSHWTEAVEVVTVGRALAPLRGRASVKRH